LNSQTANINVNDVFAAHAQNNDILQYCYGLFECYEKTATLVKFRAFGIYDPSYDKGYIIDNIILDNIPEGGMLSDPSFINFSPLIYNIFTIINPKFNFSQKAGEKYSKGDNIERVDRIHFHDSISCLFFLNLSESWKFKNMLIADSVIFYTSGGLTQYVANTTSEIATVSDNSYFNQKEYELNLIYNSITLKNNAL
jgi:hypothetical protein